MILELATVDDRTIGWRITIGSQRFLIFKDQAGMPGVRIGDAFVPGLLQTIEYRVVYDSTSF